jgi:hypothetical protein
MLRRADHQIEFGCAWQHDRPFIGLLFLPGADAVCHLNWRFGISERADSIDHNSSSRSNPLFPMPFQFLAIFINFI